MDPLTINEFIKAMKAEFGDCEYRAEKEGQVITSKGWKDLPPMREFPAQIWSKPK